MMEEISGGEKQTAEINLRYDTKKSLGKNQVYNSWRLKNPLTLSEVEVIEQSCSEMMELYGYKPFSGSGLSNWVNTI